MESGELLFCAIVGYLLINLALCLGVSIFMWIEHYKKKDLWSWLEGGEDTWQTELNELRNLLVLTFIAFPYICYLVAKADVQGVRW